MSGDGHLRRRASDGHLDRGAAAGDPPDAGRALRRRSRRGRAGAAPRRGSRAPRGGRARRAGPAGRAGAACPPCRPGAPARPARTGGPAAPTTSPAPLSAGERLTLTSSRTASQPASRSVDGEIASPATTAPVTGSCGGASSAVASRARHSVSRVQVRSVSPATWLARRCSNAFIGFFDDSASVMRRCASFPTASSDGTAGASPGHQATTGRVGQQQRHHHAGARRRRRRAGRSRAARSPRSPRRRRRPGSARPAGRRPCAGRGPARSPGTGARGWPSWPPRSRPRWRRRRR